MKVKKKSFAKFAEMTKYIMTSTADGVFKHLDIRKLAEQLQYRWNYDKVDKTPWSEAYSQIIVY